MSLRDLYNDEPKKSPIRSGTQALIDEAEQQYADENDDSTEENNYSQNLDDGNLQSIMQNTNNPTDVRSIDRFIKIKGIPPVRKGDADLAQWSDGGFLEQLVINNLTKLEQKRMLRKWRDVRDLAESEGSYSIMKAHADALTFETLCHRSDVDNENTPNERSQFNTSNSNIRSTTRQTNISHPKSGGIFSKLFGR